MLTIICLLITPMDSMAQIFFKDIKSSSRKPATRVWHFSQKFKLGVLIVLGLLLLAGSSLALYAYAGAYLGEESSPNHQYTLRYYRSLNPFKVVWSVPGDSACQPRWIRLYDK